MCNYKFKIGEHIKITNKCFSQRNSEHIQTLKNKILKIIEYDSYFEGINIPVYKLDTNIPGVTLFDEFELKKVSFLKNKIAKIKELIKNDI